MSMFSHFKMAPLFLALLATLVLSACTSTSSETP